MHGSTSLCIALLVQLAIAGPSEPGSFSLGSVAGAGRATALDGEGESSPGENQDSPADAADSGSGRYSFELGGSWRSELLPDDLIYPRYIADPWRPTNAILYQKYTSTEIPTASDTRYLFKLGFRKGLVRFDWGEESSNSLQFDIMMGWLGVFDIKNQQDNLGWDGLYGWFFSYANDDGFAVQFGTKHRSAHLGDEYIENTGSERIGYSRNEMVLGLGLTELGCCTLYFEGGYGGDLLNEDLQDPWRFQGGLVVENDEAFFRGRSGWYGALDLQAFEETDWALETTAQLGLVFPASGLVDIWRLGLEFRDGRSIFGEFFAYDETSISLGLWMDF
jgi:hypothetical protein